MRYDYAMRRSLFILVLMLIPAWTASAQTPSGSPARAPEPPLRRWFEFQQFVLSTRYRVIESSADVVTSNQMQYREQIRGRVNLDPQKRYTVNFGYFSGSSFTSSWDNLGPGTGDFDGKDHYNKQLFVSATPVKGIEGQFGGLYPERGESTEFTTYDDDGYLVGGRISVRRPASLYLDEISVAHGTLGPANVPNLWKRWDDLDDTNYTQVLVAKRFAPSVAASLDYTNAASTDTIRGAVALRFKAGAPISALRYEQYVRTSDDSAAGFAVTADRPITRWLRTQVGYATIDEHYGGLNADRIQRGRRFYATANVQIWGPLSASLFATRALNAPYSISNKTRFDAVLAWDVLNSLRKTGTF
jgi:hypothetical protein